MAIESIIRANQATGAYRRAAFDDLRAPAVDEMPLPPPPAAAEPVEPPAMPESLLAAEPAPELDTPFEIAPGVRLPTAEDIEQIQRDAHKEGYAAGYEEGSARGRFEAAELHQLLTEVKETLAGLDTAIGKEILALSLEVARLVVRDHLKQHPESIEAVVHEALTQLPQQHASLHVNPEDAALIRQYIGEQHPHAGHRVVEDDTIARGGCKIDSGNTQVDASVATRWRRVVENLSREHPWEDEA